MECIWKELKEISDQLKINKKRGRKRTFELVHVDSSKRLDSASSPENINPPNQLNLNNEKKSKYLEYLNIT